MKRKKLKFEELQKIEGGDSLSKIPGQIGCFWFSGVLYCWNYPNIYGGFYGF